MPIFEYVDETSEGSLGTGTIEALNKEHAVKKLLKSGIRLIRIDELNYTQQKTYDRLERLKRLKNYISPQRVMPKPLAVKKKKRNYIWLLWLIIPAIVLALIWNNTK